MATTRTIAKLPKEHPGHHDRYFAAQHRESTSMTSTVLTGNLVTNLFIKPPLVFIRVLTDF